MDYQSVVPVKIPPLEDIHMATSLKTHLPEDWLVFPYSAPVVGHGVAISGPNTNFGNGPRYAFVYVHPDKVVIGQVIRSFQIIEKIIASVKLCTSLPVEIVWELQTPSRRVKIPGRRKGY